MQKLVPTPLLYRRGRCAVKKCSRSFKAQTGWSETTISTVAEKLIGSLIYGDHPIPKRARAWKERLKVPVTIGLVLLLIGGVAYKFANFREERVVRQFVEAVNNGRYDAAYQHWESDERYTMKDFLQDWGKDGYYTKGMVDPKVVDSNSKGGGVVVYVGLDNFKEPVAILVNKDTLKLSFSPANKYSQ